MIADRLDSDIDHLVFKGGKLPFLGFGTELRILVEC
jgi:hypothetical protein